MQSKIVLWVIILLVIVLGAWWYFAQTPKVTAPTSVSTQTEQTAAPVAPQPTTVNGISTTDTSDAAISQDTAAVDAQMSSLNSDNTSVDSGMSTQ